jgi:hypothetical protein
MDTKKPEEGHCSKCMVTNLAVQAIVILVLVYLVYKVGVMERYVNAPRNYIGSGLPNAVFTSGATMRRLAQKFSSTDQGQYLTVHNAEIADDDERDRTKIQLVAFPVESVPPQILADAIAGNVV